MNLQDVLIFRPLGDHLDHDSVEELLLVTLIQNRHCFRRRCPRPRYGYHDTQGSQVSRDKLQSDFEYAYSQTELFLQLLAGLTDQTESS